uniref:Uncharacterized protein n=1 Tax=mine drainage metagenome TaxID=410659 RepID=E6QW98_9ZZZZ
MNLGNKIKIHSSAFKHIMMADMFFHSFTTDVDLCRSHENDEQTDDERIKEVESLIDPFISANPYCSQFALSTGDMTPRRFDYLGKYMEFRPGPTGFPTVRDFDILLYCQSWLGNASLEGRDDDISDLLEFEIEDFYEFSGRSRNSDRGEAFEQALERLHSSTMTTNTKPFGLDSKEVTQKYLKEYDLARDEQGRITTVTVRVLHRTCHLLKAEAFSLYHKDFILQSPVRRTIYMYLSINCFYECEDLTLSFAQLHKISELAAPLRKLSSVIDDLVENPLPGFVAEVNEEDETVTFVCEFRSYVEL